MFARLVLAPDGLSGDVLLSYHRDRARRAPGRYFMTEGMLRREEGGFPSAGVPAGGGSDGVGLGHLLQRIAGGDRAALRRLYDLGSPRLYAIALRITRDKELASDALHDAFMQVLKQAGRFDPARGSAEAWLVSLVRYRALDIVRGRGREVLGYEPADQPGFEPDALDLLAATEEGTRLRACLGALEEERRRLIMLAFVDGLSHHDLATRLGLPLGTVKSAIRRGLLKLRECLGQ